MKKFLIATLVLFIGLGTVTYAMPAETEVSSQAGESYRDIAYVNVAVYNNSSRVWNYHKYKLYAGENTCDSYYLKESDGYYYPCRKNYDSQFKGKDVSEYSWVCKTSKNTYFFNY